MSEPKKRKVHTPEYKAKVALEALRSGKTINQISQEFDVHPVQVGLWKKTIFAWTACKRRCATMASPRYSTAIRTRSSPAPTSPVYSSAKRSRSAWTGVVAPLTYIFVERLWRNVKYEDIYLKGYATVCELLLGLSDYFVLYNSKRPHQSLQYKTPDPVHASASGGGALIIDKYAKEEGVEKSNRPCAGAGALLDGQAGDRHGYVDKPAKRPA